MKSFLPFLAGALVACSSPLGSSSSAIVGGALDTQTTGVVMVYIKPTAGGWGTCSGTVVSPHVVVTAAHCVDPTIVGPASYSVYVGDDVYASPPASDFFAATKTIEEPAFSAATIMTKGHDVGLVITTDALPRTPIAFARSLDASLVGQTATLVGFGETDPADASSDGRRSSAETTVAKLSDIEVVTANQLPSGCEGDSGGALLVSLGGVPTLAGVISHGLSLNDCKGASYTERIDLETSFVEAAVDQYDPGFFAPDAGAPDAGDDESVTEPQPSSGCDAAPGARGSWGAVALALALTAANRRVRRTRAR